MSPREILRQDLEDKLLQGSWVQETAMGSVKKGKASEVTMKCPLLHKLSLSNLILLETPGAKEKPVQ